MSLKVGGNNIGVVFKGGSGSETADHSELDNLDYEHSGHTGFQPALVSGQNIKTINNQSLLGSGNITIEGGPGGTAPIVSNETLEFLQGSSARVEGEELIF